MIMPGLTIARALSAARVAMLIAAVTMGVGSAAAQGSAPQTLRRARRRSSEPAHCARRWSSTER